MSLRLDGHKLAYHPEATDAALSGRPSAPVYVEIGPTGVCNHRCLFCHYNHLGHTGKMDAVRLLELPEEMAAMRVKSVVIAGIGEPLVHPETMGFILKSNLLGLDVAMSTNAALLDMEKARVVCENLSWIRVSMNGYDAKSYAKVHSTKLSEYDKVMNNIAMLIDTKRSLKSNATIGIQFLLLPENKDGVVDAARKAKDMGADYFVVKHFYEHDKNIYSPDMSFATTAFVSEIASAFNLLCDESFYATIRSLDILESNRPYTRCLALPLIAYIREDGTVFSCFSNQHDNKTALGNITDRSFKDVWESGMPKVQQYIDECIDKNSCQPACRHDQLNRYLWELKHPSVKHINFI